jgi:hypothetical protein
MKKFILKIISTNNNLYSDSTHELGGYDVVQHAAFTHLIGDDHISDFYRPTLVELAELHGWEVNIKSSINLSK